MANLTPVNSGVVWLGFLIRLTSGPNAGYSVINLTAGTGTNDFPGYGVLAFSPNVFGIDNDGPGFVETTIAPSNETTWIVVRIDFDLGKQDMYINPSGARRHARRAIAHESRVPGRWLQRSATQFRHQLASINSTKCASAPPSTTSALATDPPLSPWKETEQERLTVVQRECQSGQACICLDLIAANQG